MLLQIKKKNAQQPETENHLRTHWTLAFYGKLLHRLKSDFLTLGKNSMEIVVGDVLFHTGNTCHMRRLISNVHSVATWGGGYLELLWIPGMLYIFNKDLNERGQRNQPFNYSCSIPLQELVHLIYIKPREGGMTTFVSRRVCKVAMTLTRDHIALGIQKESKCSRPPASPTVTTAIHRPPSTTTNCILYATF